MISRATNFGRATRINLSAEVFWKFIGALADPTEDMPTLRRYAKKRSPIPKGLS